MMLTCAICKRITISDNLYCSFDTQLRNFFATAGYITATDMLPVTRLNFGRTVLETSSGVHTLGRLECMGHVAVNGMPRSCEDLWQIGHILSGIYSVRGAKSVESVYCEFAKLPTDPSIV